MTSLPSPSSNTEEATTQVSVSCQALAQVSLHSRSSDCYLSMIFSMLSSRPRPLECWCPKVSPRARSSTEYSARGEHSPRCSAGGSEVADTDTKRSS